jgi:hypothetical protein
MYTTRLVPSHLKLLSIKLIIDNTPNTATRYNPVNATPSTPTHSRVPRRFRINPGIISPGNPPC